MATLWSGFFLIVAAYELFTNGSTASFWGLAILSNIWAVAARLERR